jgi:hypothetical protein
MRCELEAEAATVVFDARPQACRTAHDAAAHDAARSIRHGRGIALPRNHLMRGQSRDRRARLTVVVAAGDHHG